MFVFFPLQETIIPGYEQLMRSWYACAFFVCCCCATVFVAVVRRIYCTYMENVATATAATAATAATTATAVYEVPNTVHVGIRCTPKSGHERVVYVDVLCSACVEHS